MIFLKEKKNKFDDIIPLQSFRSAIAGTHGGMVILYLNNRVDGKLVGFDLHTLAEIYARNKLLSPVNLAIHKVD
jgi:hypothetical protein